MTNPLLQGEALRRERVEQSVQVVGVEQAGGEALQHANGQQGVPFQNDLTRIEGGPPVSEGGITVKYQPTMPKVTVLEPIAIQLNDGVFSFDPSDRGVGEG